MVWIADWVGGRAAVSSPPSLRWDPRTTTTLTPWSMSSSLAMHPFKAVFLASRPPFPFPLCSYQGTTQGITGH